MLSSLFVETGPFSGGWTAYPPLSALDELLRVQNRYGFWLVAMAFLLCLRYWAVLIILLPS